MPGSLNDILPDPISVENQTAGLDHFKRKMKIAAEFDYTFYVEREEENYERKIGS
jgi:hypothetical protein